MTTKWDGMVNVTFAVWALMSWAQVCVCVYVELLSVCDGARRVAPWAPAALTALPQLHSGETDVVAAAWKL